MKRTLSVGMTAATFMMTVALAAQAPAPQQPPSSTPQQPPSTTAQPPSAAQPRTESAAGKITVSGCIEKADAQQPSAMGFVLTNAKAASSSGTVGTTGTPSPSTPPSSSATSAAGTTYRLDADSEKLSPHVGHRVEIVGTTSSSGASGAAAPAPDAGGRSAASPAASLKVESIKMVSQNCN